MKWSKTGKKRNGTRERNGEQRNGNGTSTGTKEWNREIEKEGRNEQRQGNEKLNGGTEWVVRKGR